MNTRNQILQLDKKLQEIRTQILIQMQNYSKPMYNTTYDHIHTPLARTINPIKITILNEIIYRKYERLIYEQIH